MMVELPDKLYFRIGEVSQIAELPASVLRFWETEFSVIKPRRAPSGRRMYRRREVELILQIKHLLYERRYTIAGARRYLANHGRRAIMVEQRTLQQLQHIRRELIEIRDMLLP